LSSSPLSSSVTPSLFHSRLKTVNSSNTCELWKSVKNVSHASDSGTSIANSIGDVINRYFADVATDVDYDRRVGANYLRNANHVHRRVETVSGYDVYRVLSKLKKTSPDPDQILYWLFKHCSHELSDVVAYLLNKLWQISVSLEARGHHSNTKDCEAKARIITTNFGYIYII